MKVTSINMLIKYQVNQQQQQQYDNNNIDILAMVGSSQKGINPYKWLT